jgi:hypothetical protein
MPAVIRSIASAAASSPVLGNPALLVFLSFVAIGLLAVALILAISSISKYFKRRESAALGSKTWFGRKKMTDDEKEAIKKERSRRRAKLIWDAMLADQKKAAAAAISVASPLPTINAIVNVERIASPLPLVIKTREISSFAEPEDDLEMCLPATYNPKTPSRFLSLARTTGMPRTYRSTSYWKRSVRKINGEMLGPLTRKVSKSSIASTVSSVSGMRKVSATRKMSAAKPKMTTQTEKTGAGIVREVLAREREKDALTNERRRTLDDEADNENIFSACCAFLNAWEREWEWKWEKKWRQEGNDKKKRSLGNTRMRMMAIVSWESKVGTGSGSFWFLLRLRFVFADFGFVALLFGF